MTTWSSPPRVATRASTSPALIARNASSAIWSRALSVGRPDRRRDGVLRLPLTASARRNARPTSRSR